jgi:hypothetical protein
MRYSTSHTKAGVNTADTIMWEIRPGSNDDVYVYEIGLSIASAPINGPQWRVVRSTTVGTASSQATPVLEGPGSNTANARLDLTWSANPTTAAQGANTDLRRFTTSPTIGNGIVWTWYDQPLYVAAGAGLCIVNGIATGTTLGSFQIYVRFDE